MKFLRPFSATMVGALMSACASSSVDTSQTQSLTCADLDVAIGVTAKQISSVAIRRGNVRSYDVPFWLLGANRAKDALVDRDTRKVEELQAAQTQLTAERDRRCR